MPEYLGPYDEPDFASLATVQTRIPTKRKAGKIETLTMKKDDSASKAILTTQPAQNVVMSSLKSEEISHKGRKGKKLKGDAKVHSQNRPSRRVTAGVWNDGCTRCGKDNDHPNLLVCEACDTEIHTYCLSPPLDSVPEDDWFCGKWALHWNPSFLFDDTLTFKHMSPLLYRPRCEDACISRIEKDGDILDALIRKLPVEMVARFGEIVWAKTGDKGHWWPSLIFDPRSFLGNAEVVELAKNNLGKRYLVYFFETSEAFGAIQDVWILKWDVGMKRHYDTGKSLQGGSKTRIHQFRLALQAATMAMEDSSYIPEFDSAIEPKSSKHTIYDAHNSAAGKSSIQSQGDADLGDFHPEENPTTPEGAFDIDSEWLSARDYALAEVAGTRQEGPVQIDDDETTPGICLRPAGRWQAQIYFHGKSRYIGTFRSRGEAALAFKLVRNRLMLREGESASTSLSRNDGRPPVDVASEGTVHSSFSNLFSRRYSPKQQSARGVFKDKRPNRTKYLLSRTMDSLKRDVKNRVSENRQERHVGRVQRNTRHKDQERSLVVRSTPFCQFYLAPLV